MVKKLESLALQMTCKGSKSDQTRPDQTTLDRSTIYPRLEFIFIFITALDIFYVIYFE